MAFDAPFDVEAIRAQFPILGRTVHGKPLIYLDTAASAQKPEVVLDAMMGLARTSYANVHRGLHTLANETTEAYEKARESVARFINAEPTEIVWTKSATEAVNLVAATFGQSLTAGDEIVISEMEHHANIVPWHFLRERKGVVLKFVPVLDDGRLDMEAYRGLLSERTRMVALTQMSNVLGTVNDVPEIVRLAHAAGAQVLIDGCQGVVHSRVDVKALDVDYYVFSGHKLYGPTGIGVLYGKAERLAALPPYQGGGEMIGSVSMDVITYADPPHRFEAGTPAILEAVGLGAAIEWLNGLDRDAIFAHEHALYARVAEHLRGVNGLQILGEAPGKGAVLSFTVEGIHAHDLAQVLDRYGVAVRAGTHCAEPLMRRFGVTSSARASFALYNTEAEADAFVDALAKARRFFS
ncbi:MULTISPECIES: aminotransferase class V-fold PLP-dependent enzyme [unclassified Caulobacter]|uniref:aminotransferase class V-fold PLP-dependent enzyme n=1 Tax=unclassified Caulobacter TaxID=2648921 RepID=UPI000D388E73|nr:MULTISPECIES: cysteine desulfurase [unclassified Caulobacter]PTS89177.1 cysteine desulfurase [Caulobacter sp. HMWF009]PTT10004.1 cysteine desulfurase [Caulobacter sp. HMWF025]